ncbi:hypothetical protein [Falsiroseomonas sp.]|uniref:hypothetical protein n=1 Tax=Falsiroseomonas sp. TaxID=2870721 RepID=UPI00271B8916|nr:hypothetical protein [Falsiroseomonas sp.]MDO9503324.1 hypothetical protein [Falsiroseomonas sp.]MDP3416831.1 hypothetical protein [Falsiroseomonas sp.]
MRVFPALALATTLLLGACQNPDGSVNVPASLALGAGAALGVAAIASANDNSHRHRGYYRQPQYGYSRPYYGRGHGYNRGYRGW